jgi:hypothetical protein
VLLKCNACFIRIIKGELNMTGVDITFKSREPIKKGDVVKIIKLHMGSREEEKRVVEEVKNGKVYIERSDLIFNKDTGEEIQRSLVNKSFGEEHKLIIQ